MLQYISGVENADPNDTTSYDEDNSNVGWGHKQCAGLAAMILSWSDVGSVETACRLLAALIKTARAARFICFKRKIRLKESQSYTADAYVDCAVDILSALLRTSSKPVRYMSSVSLKECI